MPISPLETYQPDPRDMLIFDIADVIGAALSGPEDIGVLEVAEMTVDQIEESQIFREKARVRVKARSRMAPAS
ncbi:hypothetical protein [Mesorhizobium sp. 8]|uniref:hypothetical protein n=1 Tax=Mesorhizobium sp. 8 TaxID=2584466 RepID=UPI0011226AE9|nr:hypothetical protein [Mesorhizobium sp. 8]QDC02307.1 hypothetical protein FGU64_18740 [Mesorhizobium sp. 8]